MWTPRYTRLRTLSLNARHLIGFYVTFYMTTSISVVMMNKYLMSSFAQVDGPVFLTWFQLLMTLLILYATGEVGKRYSRLSILPPFEFRLDVAKRVSPLSICFSLMILSNNYCLNYVDVSFFQIARALTIPFNILFTFAILSTKTSPAALRASMIVVVGYLVGCTIGTIEVSVAGVLFGLSASCFVSLNSILVKRTLPIVENNQWRLMHYNTVLALVILFPFLVFSGEVDTLFPGLLDPYFWFIMIITGLLGFIINLSTILCVKYTSPLTYSVASNAKSAVQALLGFFVFSDAVSLQTIAGNALTIGGSLYYSTVRSNEMNKKKEPDVESGEK